RRTSKSFRASCGRTSWNSCLRQYPLGLEKERAEAPCGDKKRERLTWSLTCFDFFPLGLAVNRIVNRDKQELPHAPPRPVSSPHTKGAFARALTQRRAPLRPPPR